MLNKVKNIYFFNLKNILKDKKKLIVIFIIPFLLMIYIAAGLVVEEKQNNNINIVVVDNENSFLSRMLIKKVTKEKTLSDLITFKTMNLELAKKELEDGKLTAILVIPENFSTGLMYMENYPLNIILDKNDILSSYLIENICSSFSEYITSVEVSAASLYGILIEQGISVKEAASVNDAASYELISLALDRKNFFEFIENEEIPSVSSIFYHIVAVEILIIFFIGSLFSIEVSDEKDKKLLLRIKNIGVSNQVTIFTKLISYLTVMVLQAVIIFIPVTYVITNEKLNFINIIIYFMICSYFILAFWRLIEAFVKNKQAIMFLGSALTLIFAVLGGTFFPIYLMPYSMRNLAKFTPNFWLSKYMMYVVNGSTLLEILIPVIAIIALSTIMIVIAAFKEKDIRRTSGC